MTVVSSCRDRASLLLFQALLVGGMILISTQAFIPSSAQFAIRKADYRHKLESATQVASTKDDDDDKENPYADPNYPDLEFINYSDPEYQVDQGVSDEFFDAEEQIEAMREERRRRNDEYQFQTYFKEILGNGAEYKGEWTVFKTSTFMPEYADKDTNTIPRLIKVGSQSALPLTVVSRGYKKVLDTVKSTAYTVDAERIIHEERFVSLQESDNTDDDNNNSATLSQLAQELVGNLYGPSELAATDFRGHQGIMVCGNAWTICHAIQMQVDNNDADDKLLGHVGPFSEYRSEVGLVVDDMRLRIKLDYAVLEKDMTKTNPKLHLKTMIICRETKEAWPRLSTTRSVNSLAQGLFGTPGAEGGLYDPPPVGGEEQAGQYIMLDIEGRASVLLPYLMDQDPQAHNGNGWVTSLDWAPGKMRFQVDRKVNGGTGILGLRTLELSEVQSDDAETYRPRDGGRDMRQ